MGSDYSGDPPVERSGVGIAEFGAYLKGRFRSGYTKNGTGERIMELAMRELRSERTERGDFACDEPFVFRAAEKGSTNGNGMPDADAVTEIYVFPPVPENPGDMTSPDALRTRFARHFLIYGDGGRRGDIGLPGMETSIHINVKGHRYGYGENGNLVFSD